MPTLTPAHTALLQAAQTHAQAARFPALLTVCRQITEAHAVEFNTLLDVGALLSNFGFLTPARECFGRARAIAPDDLRPLVNLANLARDSQLKGPGSN